VASSAALVPLKKDAKKSKNVGDFAKEMLTNIL